MTFAELREFDELLADASIQAGTDWEVEFVADLQERREHWGVSLLLTSSQWDKLVEICNQ